MEHPLLRRSDYSEPVQMIDAVSRVAILSAGTPNLQRRPAGILIIRAPK